MIINRTFRVIFSLTNILTFLIASYIVIPDDFLKNFNIVALRLKEIFSYTRISDLSVNNFLYIFILFLFIFAFYIYKDLFNNHNISNKLQVFLIQELKFTTSIIVIFWVLKILDFSRLTIVTSSVIRSLLAIIFLKSYSFIKNKYEIKEILHVNLDNNKKLSFDSTLNGIVIKKEIYNINAETLYEELKSSSYDEIWITGSRNLNPNIINNIINQIVEYGLGVRVDNLLDIKTSIKPTFDIISNKNFISYTTSYLDTNQYFFKRIFDILFTILIATVLVPICFITCLLIILDSGFPVLFSQSRGGINAKKFTIYKFRTMYVGAESQRKDLLDQNDLDGIGFKLHNDPRVTKIGNYLRKYSIDEIPQFINVLKGDMSLVGPRPAVYDEIERYEIWHRRRLTVRPGITGPWQLTDRLSTDFNERIRLDLNYIDNQTFLNDLIIIAKTPFFVFKNKSA